MRVNIDSDNLPVRTKRLGYYAFPDPGLFVTPARDDRKARFVESWLRAHAAWTLRLRMERSLAMSAQMWRDFLATDVYNTVDHKERSAKRRREILDTIVPPPDSQVKLPAVKARSTRGEPMMWGNRSFTPGSLPPDDVVREILWELYELNFASEFLALDLRIWQGTGPQTREQRTALISMTVSNFRTIPKANTGLAADHIKERFAEIWTLAGYMHEWHECPLYLVNVVVKYRKHLVTTFLEEQMLLIEDHVAVFYTQSFFNTFGRAAQIPHRLYKPKV